MATITLTYDGRNSIAQKALDFLLSLGIFNVGTNSSTTMSAAEKRTRKAIEELDNGKGIVCNSFEDYLKAVQ